MIFFEFRQVLAKNVVFPISYITTSSTVKNNSKKNKLALL